MNRARAIVQMRIAQLVEEGDEAEADRLRAIAAKPVFPLLRSIDDRNEAYVQAIRLAYRQTEGLIGSLMRLLGLDWCKCPLSGHRPWSGGALT